MTRMIRILCLALPSIGWWARPSNRGRTTETRDTKNVKGVFTRLRISCAMPGTATARTADKRASGAKNLKKRSGVAATTTTWITTTITNGTKHQWSDGPPVPPPTQVASWPGEDARRSIETTNSIHFDCYDFACLFQQVRLDHRA